MIRLNDRSFKWQMPTLTCSTCQQQKPHAAFMVQRKTGDCLGNTCQDCRTPRSDIQKIKAAVAKQRLRAKRYGMPSTLTFDEWLPKLNASNGCCYHCGAQVGINALTIDHLVALCNGGPNSIENVAPSCWSCNLHKTRTNVADSVATSPSIAEIAHPNAE